MTIFHADYAPVWNSNFVPFTRTKRRKFTFRAFNLFVTLAACLIWGAAGCSRSDELPKAAGVLVSQDDADFALRLALLQGHLMVGGELVRAGQPQKALPHFGHPVHELYGDLRPMIEARHGRQFADDLVALEALAAAEPNSQRFQSKFDNVLLEVNAVRATIPPATLEADAYVLRLVADIATNAALEYREALIAGRFASMVEYHDVRGFLSYARLLIAEHKSSNPRVREAKDTIDRLLAMTPSLNPPEPPIGTDSEFQAMAARLRRLANRPY